MVGSIKRVFAILQEPASYTVDRNRAVYDQLGISYCYIENTSEAKSEESYVKCLSGLSHEELEKHLIDILTNNDIVIMNGYTGPIFKMLFRLNRKFRRVIGIDSDTQLRIPKNVIKRIGKWVYLNHIFRNKYVYGLAGGSGSHKKLFCYYGMSENRICLMPMVVNNERFQTRESRKKSARFRFIYVGRIVDVKNLTTMLDAFVKAFPGCNDVELWVVGKGDLLESYICKYDEYKNIVFVGPRYGDELVTEYQNASAFILPSSYEPWGLVVNEAMAAGLPVIVSDQVGAAHDLVKGRDTGFIFPYHDVDALAKCMHRLVDDQDLYQHYSENASKLMKEYWNYDLYTRCLKDFIEKASGNA